LLQPPTRAWKAVMFTSCFVISFLKFFSCDEHARPVRRPRRLHSWYQLIKLARDSGYWVTRKYRESQLFHHVSTFKPYWALTLIPRQRWKWWVRWARAPRDRTCFDPVIYLLTEIETETEIEIMSLTETKRETEMFSKTETKYKRTSQRTKRNINWNENDFKTKMITYVGKNRHFSASIWFLSFPAGADNQSNRSSASTCATIQVQIDQNLHELRARATLPEEDAITFWSRRQAAYPLLAPLTQDLVAVPASQAYVERVFSVCGWLTAGRRNRLSKNLETLVFLKRNKDVWLYDWSSKE